MRAFLSEVFRRHGFMIALLFILFGKLLQREHPLQDLLYISVSIVVLGFLIFVHELGHALCYYWRGIGIACFSIGMGTPLLRYYWRGCELRIGSFPIGGYVMPCSETLVSERQEELAALESQQAAYVQLLRDESRFIERARPIDRLLGAAAGPAASLLLGMVCSYVVYLNWGVPDEIIPLRRPLVVAEVEPGSRAAAADIHVGDVLRSVESIEDGSAGGGVRLEVYRGATPVCLFESRSVESLREFRETRLLDGLRCRSAPIEWSPIDPMSGLLEAVRSNLIIFGFGIVSPFVLAYLIVGRLNPALIAQAGGPVAVVSILSSSVEFGTGQILLMLGLLSSAIGGLNSFPGTFGWNNSYPLLDGGKMLKEACTMLFGEENRLFLYCSRAMTPVMSLLFICVLFDIARLLWPM